MVFKNYNKLQRILYQIIKVYDVLMHFNPHDENLIFCCIYEPKKIKYRLFQLKLKFYSRKYNFFTVYFKCNIFYFKYGRSLIIIK